MWTRQYILMGIHMPPRIWGKKSRQLGQNPSLGPRSARGYRRAKSPRYAEHPLPAAALRFSRTPGDPRGEMGREARWGWERKHDGLRHGGADKSVLAENATCFESVSFQLRALLPAPADA